MVAFDVALETMDVEFPEVAADVVVRIELLLDELMVTYELDCELDTAGAKVVVPDASTVDVTPMLEEEVVVLDASTVEVTPMLEEEAEVEEAAVEAAVEEAAVEVAALVEAAVEVLLDAVVEFSLYSTRAPKTLPFVASMLSQVPVVPE